MDRDSSTVALWRCRNKQQLRTFLLEARLHMYKFSYLACARLFWMFLIHHITERSTYDS